jgi:hypothetical protein
MPPTDLAIGTDNPATDAGHCRDIDMFRREPTDFTTKSAR